jgi:hypothetical protein
MLKLLCAIRKLHAHYIQVAGTQENSGVFFIKRSARVVSYRPFSLPISLQQTLIVWELYVSYNSGEFSGI